MIDLYRRKVVAVVSQLAKDDPELVMAFIRKLRRSGEVAPDDLTNIERIAKKWMQINRENRKKARR